MFLLNKIFIIKKGVEIPSFSTDKAYIHYNVSDKYLAKTIAVNGDIVFNTVMYDFKNKKWISSNSGLKEVVEYYIENDGFNKWLKEVNDINLDLLFEIYNAMDKEDK